MYTVSILDKDKVLFAHVDINRTWDFAKSMKSLFVDTTFVIDYRKETSHDRPHDLKQAIL